MSPPNEKADVTTTPAPSQRSAPQPNAPKRSEKFLAAVAALPFTVPRWLDRLAVRAAQRLGREGKL